MQLGFAALEHSALRWLLSVVEAEAEEDKKEMHQALLVEAEVEQEEFLSAF
jgi:hypothetical protein